MVPQRQVLRRNRSYELLGIAMPGILDIRAARLVPAPAEAPKRQLSISSKKECFMKQFPSPMLNRLERKVSGRSRA